MPRGIPKTKHEPAAGTEEQGNGATGATGQENKTTKAAGRKKGKRVNKLQCVREAIAELGNDAQPKDIQDFLKRRFNLDMNTKFISTYKGTILRSAARESGVIREPAAAAAGGVRGGAAEGVRGGCGEERWPQRRGHPGDQGTGGPHRGRAAQGTRRSAVGVSRKPPSV